MRRALMLVGAMLALSISAAAQGGIGSIPVSAAGIYKWQLGVGFQYNRINLTGNPFNTGGLNTSVVRFLNRWVGIEGQADSGFGNTRTATFPPNLRAKSVFLGGGPRIAFRSDRSRFEPWIHFLGGMEHFRITQNTGPVGSSITSLAGLVGGGTEFYLNPEIALRGEVDWIGTRFYSLNQRHFQAVTGIVFNF